ncbi:MAG: hypothetical protein IKC42_06045 [Alistipes sp.]|nr:hypothetical protein [Alistipes sp.]
MKKILLTLAAIACIVPMLSAKQPPIPDGDRIKMNDRLTTLRRIVSIPNIDGYITLKGDFHMHTVYADAHVSPAERVREAWCDGLDVIAMTEHIAVHKSKGIKLKDYNLPNQLAVKEGKKYGLLVVPGAEITRTKPFGHMNALFMKDCNVFEEERYLKDENGKLLRDKKGSRIPNRATEMTDFEAAEKQGAYIIWNHPGWPDGKCTLYPFHKSLIEQGRIHGVEIYNAYEWYPRVLSWFDDFKISMFANSDAHMPSAVTYRYLRPMTLVFAKERTLESLREAMFAGRIVALFDNTLAGSADLIAQLAKASLQIMPINAKKGYVEVTNISDIEFRVEYGTKKTKSFVFPARSAVRVTIPQGEVLTLLNCYAGRSYVTTTLW